MLKKIIIIAVCSLCSGNFLLAQERQSTANKNVHVVDTSFYIPQLNRHRRIWIYLPAGYAYSKKNYPVIYLHDGQNVFDNKTSFAGEWGVDEAMDTLGALIKESIIVAIDNGGDKRLSEYSPYDFKIQRSNEANPSLPPLNIKAEGTQYVNFVVKTLRPYINKNYRTKNSRRYTFIAGSSMGGLISLYAMLKYPKVFGGAGIFSPSLWVSEQIKKDIAESKKLKGKIYLYAGQQEGGSMVPDLLAIFNSLHKYSKTKLTTVIRAEGMHNESSWRKEFPIFYKWLLK